MQADKKIAIHFGPKTDPEQHDRVVTRSYGGLVSEIERRGYAAVITRGAANYDFEDGTLQELWVPERDAEGNIRTRRHLGEVALEVIGSMRDLGKKLRPSREHFIPTLNDPATLPYNHSKLKMFQDLLYSMQGETHLLYEDVADHFKGELVVVKPDKGSGGQGIHVISRRQLNGLMAHLAKTVPEALHVVQEYVDMTHPFPADITGLDEEETALLEKLKDRKKELGVFCFYGEGDIRMVPIARMMKEGEESTDTWVFVDPDYIPEEVFKNTTLAFDRLAKKTGKGELFGRMDYMWGTTASDSELKWRAGEINLWKPAVSRRKPEVGRRFDNAMADQLVRLAENERIDT